MYENLAKDCGHMKKIASIILLCLMIVGVVAGCGNQTVEQAQTSQTATIGNPWSDWASIEEAEAAVGFSFELPEVIADSYTAVAFRTLNNEMIEIIYRDEDFEICVRKQKGEGQDISGDYNTYEFCDKQNVNGGTVTSWHNSDNDAVKQIVSYGGYSWSLVASDGWWGDANGDFLNCVWESAG